MSDYASHVERDEEGKAVRLTFQRVPTGQGEALQRLNCAECRAPLRGKQERFCSDRCRYAAWDKAHPRVEARQASLDFTPPSAPLPPVQDQRVPTREPRLCRMSRTVLEMLRGGPVTNRTFAESFPPGAAWRTRISDARLWLEQHGETIRSRVEPGGLCTYWLEVK